MDKNKDGFVSLDEYLPHRKSLAEDIKTYHKPDVQFSRTFAGQAICAGVAGICQMYSGGIVLDTVSTRLQAGFGIGQALWGIRGYKSTNPTSLISRAAAVHGVSKTQLCLSLLKRSNLYAGIGVVVRGRFPYLTLNLGTYAQAEQWVLGIRGGVYREKTLGEDLFCIVSSTSVGAAAITAIECPKILDQLRGGQVDKANRSTVLGVIKKFGIRRLMQGYEATFLREFCFNCALLGSPGISKRLRSNFIEPNLETSAVARFFDGKEMFFTSMAMGFPIGFITNVPDQMKTNIQKGQFRNILEAIKWQSTQGGGIRGLLGKAAVYRSLYICHGVVFLNFARTRVETLLNNSRLDELF
eukprot:GSMAST32.ASY1.ANO1.1521.1 assembled CDS